MCIRACVSFVHTRVPCTYDHTTVPRVSENDGVDIREWMIKVEGGREG